MANGEYISSVTLPNGHQHPIQDDGAARISHTHGNITNDGYVGTGNTLLKTINGSVTAGPTIGTDTTKFLNNKGEWAVPAYIENVAYGNISTTGTISTTAVITANSRLIIATSASPGKIVASSLTFGTSTTTYLNNKGEWGTPPNDDTKNTAGASATTTKIFLVGTTAQSTSAQTYSNTAVYATNGALSAKTLGVNADTTASKVTLQWNATDSSLDFIFA